MDRYPHPPHSALNHRGDPDTPRFAPVAARHTRRATHTSTDRHRGHRAQPSYLRNAREAETPARARQAP